MLTGLSFFFLVIAFLLGLSAFKYHGIGAKDLRNWSVVGCLAALGLIYYVWFIRFRRINYCQARQLSNAQRRRTQ